MSAALRLVSDLTTNHRWALQTQGVVIGVTEEAPLWCFIFDAWGPVEIDQFEKEVRRLGLRTELKLIGPPDFLAKLQRWARRNNFTVMKSVVRTMPFEMIYSAGERVFRVSVEEGRHVPLEEQLDTVEVEEGSQEKIKVLIVDDSKTIGKLLTTMITKDPRIEVVATLEKPSQVEEYLKNSPRPDVMTLDIHLPEMSGVALLRKILPQYRIPTIMISSLTREDGPFVLEALEAGAFDYIQKPAFHDIQRAGPMITERIREAARTQVGRRWDRVSQIQEAWPRNVFLLIGASTGGTEAIHRLLKQFPDRIPPVLIVQHMPPVFTRAFAERLDSHFKFEVREAQDGDLVIPDRVLIAPGDRQMGIVPSENHFKVRVSEDPPINRHRPSVDYLFFSAARARLKPAIGIVLTGMGADGAKGLAELRRQGARTLAQDEASSVVYGMPKAAFLSGGAEAVVALDQMGRKITSLLSKINRLEE